MQLRLKSENEGKLTSFRDMGYKFKNLGIMLFQRYLQFVSGLGLGLAELALA